MPMITKEEWKLVPGFSDYMISSLGRVMSFKKSMSGKELSLINNGNGYLSVCLCNNGNINRFYVHTLVAKSFVENPLMFKEVNHKDGNKANNNFINLEWCNRSMNLKHAHSIGLKVAADISGNKNPKYKHGLLVRVNELKNCKVCGNEFVARLKHIEHCSRICSNKTALKTKQMKLEGYSQPVPNY